jgi:hypothetical protein
MNTKMLFISAFFLTSQLSFAQNCEWGSCTPQQRQQLMQLQQLQQLQGINNSLQQIQQQLPAAPAGSWTNTPQRQQNCNFRDMYGRVVCQ